MSTSFLYISVMFSPGCILRCSYSWISAYFYWYS